MTVLTKANLDKHQTPPRGQDAVPMTWVAEVQSPI